MGKRIRYKYKDRKGITSLFNSKGYPRGKRGQPKLKSEIKVGLITAITYYSITLKLTPYKAWLHITTLKGFPSVMKAHFKNKKGSADWWVNRISKSVEKDTGVRLNFWKNHLKVYFRKKVSD